MKATLIFSALAGLLLAQCGPKEPTQPTPVPPVTTPTDTTTVPTDTTSRPQQTGICTHAAYPVGAAVSVSKMRNIPEYRALVRREYNSVTAENAMKFSALHPSASTWTWTDADYLVDYARTNHTRVHGHTLIWHTALPGWVTSFQGSTADWENLFRTHIQTVMTHFRGKVQSWDVVNEAVDNDGTLRNSIWRQKLGDDYIARAFEYAHQADPNALLFYNDYGHEYGSQTKNRAILALVNSLKNRGIPIHGIGLQMHTNSSLSDANLQRAIREAGATGLLVHIAELDISLNSNQNASLALTPALLQLQKAKYRTVVQAFQALPAGQRFGLTTWNVSDADTWLRGYCSCPDWPLPFDDNYLPKPAYDGIREGLQ